jgi:hypothetical protein
MLWSTQFHAHGHGHAGVRDPTIPVLDRIAKALGSELILALAPNAA